jgi:hypothetical protein
VSAGAALLTGLLALTQSRRHRRLLQLAEEPRAAQAAMLRKMLAANAGTTFGRQHSFDRLRTLQDFRDAVPVQSYEDLRPLIERQELTGEPCLTRERPVFYNRTSGTLGAPKHVPITASGLARLQSLQRLAAYAYSRGSDAFAGRMLAISGPAVEGTMPGGTPYGSASGLLYQRQPRLIRQRYVLPPDVPSIADYEARYLAIARHALAEPQISCIATANPSTIVRLLSLVNANVQSLLPAAGPRRAVLERLAANTPLRLADLWPQLKAIITWTGGSCAVPLAALAGSYPPDCRVVEFGYAASELLGTVNVDAAQGRCLPAFLDTLFEFVERSAWEAGERRFLALDELEVGRDYYVFATTQNGLYRYDINDILRVTGHIGRTPTLAFVQKGKGVTSITGEKLTEAQVVDAVLSALDERALLPGFFLVLAEVEAAHYSLLLEGEAPAGLAEAIDRRLAALNTEYQGKRASGRLGPLSLQRLACGAGEAYRAALVARGQRDAQFKVMHLQYAADCVVNLARFRLADAP